MKVVFHALICLLLLVETFQQCPDGFYFYDGDCYQCNEQCHTCSSLSQCNDCKGGNRTAGTCVCLPGYIDPGDYALACQTCHYSCQTCNSLSTCTTCAAGANRVLVSGVPFCSCMPKTYDVGNQVCENCDASCMTCYGAYDTNCLTCNSTANRTKSGFSCVCEFPLLAINGYEQCCHYSCSGCSDSTSCHSCSPSNIRVLNSSGYCGCQEGYYDDGSNPMCRDCSLKCRTCNNGYTCLSCKSEHHRVFNVNTSTCDCASGYMEDGTPVCVPAPLVCKYSCPTCNGTADNCTSCNMYHYRTLVNGSCQCFDRFYDDGETYFCRQCHWSCQSCSGSSDFCTSCRNNSNRQFNQANGTCTCKPSFFQFAYQATCEPCQVDCLTCSTHTTCDTCLTTSPGFRVMNSTTSRCDCIIGYFHSNQTGMNCQKCDYRCLTCNESNTCLTCNSSLGRFLNSTTKMCDCGPGYAVSGETCVEVCQVSCLTCAANSMRLCATCQFSTRRVFNATSQQCQCPAAYYDDGINANCAACHYRCATCVNSDTFCTSCSSIRTLDATAGTCTCNPRTYDPGNLDMCYNCRQQCATCIMASECTSCNASWGRVMNTATSRCDCLTGYYIEPTDAQNCYPCNYRCRTCTNSTSCLTCNTGRANTALNCPCAGPTYENNATVCVKCHYTCATCSNGSQCLTCSSSTYRSLNNSTKQCNCISGYYDPGYNSDASTPQACLPCKAGCAVCTTSSNCQQCTNTSYYVNSTTFACSLCSSACLTCSGPASNNCLSCVFPKYVVAQMCVDVVCPFGKYVDLMGGCSACSELYENSLSCTIDEPLSCTAASKLSEQECKTCNQVTGYALNDGECKEICGDGFLIGYQCDDGNTLNGDGCSSSCSIEPGWNCSVVSNKSSCTLTAAVELSLLRMVKLPRKNVIRVTLQISLPLRLSSSNFAVSFTSLSASAFTTTILPQSQSELRSISFEIQYRASLQNQRLTLSYSQSRRLQETAYQQRGSFGAPRLLPSVSFSANLEVTTFPPANYIAADSYGFYDRASAAIFVLSLVLLFLSLVIAPKKHALHSVSVAWLVPYLYFTVFYSTGYTTDWLSPMASNLKYIALFFGFSFGPCCSSDSLLGTTSEVVSNAGAVIVVLLAFWLAYLTIFLFTLKNKAEILAKALRMAKYLLVTLHAFFFFGLIFASLNAFTKYVNSNKVDGANLFVALAVLIVTCCFLLYLWFATCTKFQANLKAASEKGSKEPSERKAFADVQPNQPSLEHDESNIVIKMSNAKNEISVVAASIHALSVPETAVQEAVEEEPFLLYDFCSLYSAHRLAKYFLPVLLSKLFLFALFSATLTANPFAMLLLHLLLSTAFLVFLIAVRPFESRLTQAKIIVIEVLLIALQLPFAIYQFYGLQSVYLQSVESYLIVEIIFLLLAAVCFAFAEQAVVWKALLAELCGSLGVEGMSRKVKDIPAPAVEEKRETIRIEEALERPLPKQEVEEKPQSQPQFKETDMVRFTHSAALPRRRERTRTAAEKTSEEQFA